ncbi:MAG: metallophosphoesterase [Phycisphaerae bacterium]|nr:metallophosphoesterase [Phycisphaerae bacterium]
MSSAADLFRRAAELIENDPPRKGNCLHLASPGWVVATGDIHGHRGNLERILAHVRAKDEPPTLILQELIHGPIDAEGRDRSVEAMFLAAKAKIERPEKVFCLMGNHEIAQITRSEITKNGHGVCQAFLEGVRCVFGDEAVDVYPAAMRFCRSLPLAARFDNGLLMTHSLPSPDRQDRGDPAVLDRLYEDDDLHRGGAAYEWTWGRNQTPEQLDELAERLGVEFFLLGHRHVQSGSMELPRRAMAINSDGPGGVIFEFHSDEKITLADAPKHLRSIADIST